MKNLINLEHEMAWVTFMHNKWEVVWIPLTDSNGKHLEWEGDSIMELCRQNFNRFGIQFGIARTSQMILGNAERDNL
jgi:hypothetical protein